MSPFRVGSEQRSSIGGRLTHNSGFVKTSVKRNLAKRNKEYYQTPAPVDLNVVVVRGIDPPPGEKALRLLGLVARYGGWLGRRRDPIGPMTLMRGMLAVLGAIHMMEQLGPLLEEVKKSPHLLGGLFCAW